MLEESRTGAMMPGEGRAGKVSLGGIKRGHLSGDWQGLSNIESGGSTEEVLSKEKGELILSELDEEKTIFPWLRTEETDEQSLYSERARKSEEVKIRRKYSLYLYIIWGSHLALPIWLYAQRSLQFAQGITCSARD